MMIALVVGDPGSGWAADVAGVLLQLLEEVLQGAYANDPAGLHVILDLTVLLVVVRLRLARVLAVGVRVAVVRQGLLQHLLVYQVCASRRRVRRVSIGRSGPQGLEDTVVVPVQLVQGVLQVDRGASFWSWPISVPINARHSKAVASISLSCMEGRCKQARSVLDQCYCFA